MFVLTQLDKLVVFISWDCLISLYTFDLLLHRHNNLFTFHYWKLEQLFFSSLNPTGNLINFFCNIQKLKGCVDDIPNSFLNTWTCSFWLSWTWSTFQNLLSVKVIQTKKFFIFFIKTIHITDLYNWLAWYRNTTALYQL